MRGAVIGMLITCACGSHHTIDDDAGDGGGDPFNEGGACPGLHRSSDLHSVVDCDGNTITMCPPDQGCSGTSCVPACQSANDNKSNIGCD